MKVIRITLPESETLVVHRHVTGAVDIGIERHNKPENLGGLEYLYSLNNAQRDQLREALRMDKA